MSAVEVVLLGTYPPTQCGLATFSHALRRALLGSVSSVEVVRVVERDDAFRAPEIAAQWRHGHPRDAARVLEVACGRDVLIVQHEYGIFDGPDGVAIVDVVESSPIPVIVVLHTVLVEPTCAQRAILEAVASAADAVVTQTDAARDRLIARYDVDERFVHVIPHGATANFESDARVPGSAGRAAGRAIAPPTILTWGLLGPGKGLEYAIDAVAALGDLDPAPRYLVAGETHPKVVAAHGEQYRRQLVDQAAALGVSDRVQFDGTYRALDELRAIVRSADIVLLPYESREQVTSGVLVEALASGKPVVATAFPHACEVLGSGGGLVVAHDDPAAMSEALRSILVDPMLAARMRHESRRIGSQHVWAVVGARYLDLARTLVPATPDVDDGLALTAS